MVQCYIKGQAKECESCPDKIWHDGNYYCTKTRKPRVLHIPPKGKKKGE